MCTGEELSGIPAACREATFALYQSFRPLWSFGQSLMGWAAEEVGPGHAGSKGGPIYDGGGWLGLFVREEPIQLTAHTLTVRAGIGLDCRLRHGGFGTGRTRLGENA